MKVINIYDFENSVYSKTVLTNLDKILHYDLSLFKKRPFSLLTAK